MVAEHIAMFASGFFTAIFFLLGLGAAFDTTTFKNWRPKTKVKIPGLSMPFVVDGRRDDNDWIMLIIDGENHVIYADPQILEKNKSL